MVEEDIVGEDSQDIVPVVPFSLHLTQSQTDMDSQVPPTMEVIEEVIAVSKLKLFLSPTTPMQ